MCRQRSIPAATPALPGGVLPARDCGSALLADERLRHDFAQRTGFDETAWAEKAVTDPARTVRTDVERLLGAPQLSPKIRISGHVYDVDTGLVSTVVDPELR